MAQSASDGRKQIAPALRGRRWCSRRGWRQEPHEVCEVLHSAHLSRKIRMIFWGPIELTAWRLVPLRRERFVGNAHFDVVRLSRENEQRRILCFPSKARNRSVLRIPVLPPADTQAILLPCVCTLVG